jgi:hypothetical protein
MHLPPELHDAILQHLDRPDFASYRLVRRSWATAGSPHLFSRLHFRTSLESLQRLSKISKRDCGRHVKHLLWNTTGSNVEARAFFEGLRIRELKYILGGPCFSPTPTKHIDESHPTSQEGNSSLGLFVLSAIFSGFPSLREIYIVTSSTPPTAMANDGWAQRSADNPSLDAWPKSWKTKHGCRRCHGLCQAITSTGRYEMEVSSLAAHASAQPLSHLRVENLSFWAGGPALGIKGFEAALAHLTRLELVLVSPGRAMAEVKSIFRATQRLKVLRLWLHSSDYWVGFDHSRAMLRLQDVFPSMDAFPEMQELEVHQMDTGEEFLMGWLLAHRWSLKTLKLHRMRMDPRGEWRLLFAGLRGRMERLESVWLDGEFEDGVGRGEGIWDMDGGEGRVVERGVLGV